MDLKYHTYYKIYIPLKSQHLSRSVTNVIFIWIYRSPMVSSENSCSSIISFFARNIRLRKQMWKAPIRAVDILLPYGGKCKEYAELMFRLNAWFYLRLLSKIIITMSLLVNHKNCCNRVSPSRKRTLDYVPQRFYFVDEGKTDWEF